MKATSQQIKRLTDDRNDIAAKIRCCSRGRAVEAPDPGERAEGGQGGGAGHEASVSAAPRQAEAQAAGGTMNRLHLNVIKGRPFYSPDVIGVEDAFHKFHKYLEPAGKAEA